jgi:hypothetical protein
MHAHTRKNMAENAKRRLLSLQSKKNTFSPHMWMRNLYLEIRHLTVYICKCIYIYIYIYIIPSEPASPSQQNIHVYYVCVCIYMYMYICKCMCMYLYMYIHPLVTHSAHVMTKSRSMWQSDKPNGTEAGQRELKPGTLGGLYVCISAASYVYMCCVWISESV